MASVVLTTLGGAVGGPVGRALGAVAGRTIDAALFGGKRREGPRLTELRVQTSSYGSAIPKLFGTMRVAGTVIWATDLRESAATTGSKTGGRTTQYSYSASFAVALSARSIRGVGRIWAEGKLLRGAAGDWKSRTGFRWYPGDEAQMPDPLIASVVGVGSAPAYRGIAYVVFEELALADFGNRIPSLTFEVIADAAPVAVGTIAGVLSDGVIGGQAGPVLGGFAAEGTSVGDAVAALIDPIGGWYAAGGGGLDLCFGAGPARTVSPGAGAPSRRRAPVEPRDVVVAYHDSARDYQTGVQQVRTPGARATERIALPAAMQAGDAAALAGMVAARLASGGEGRTLMLGWDAIDLRPGERVTIAGEDGRWRVRRVAIEADGITADLVPIPFAAPGPVAADGAPVLAADVLPGDTRLRLIEVPGAGDTLQVMAVAAGTAPGWRRATLLAGDDATGWREIGMTAAAGTIGTVPGVLGPGTAAIEDRTSEIDVVLLHDAMTLADADAAALDQGANAALIGDEIVQFGRARRMGAARWRLSLLWRGRQGSDWAMGSHGPGEGFVLLDPATLRAIDDPPPRVGRAIRAMASGIAPDDVAETAIVPDGRALVPPAPVHGRIDRVGGVLAVRWVRRARGVAGWRDSIDLPLGEEREAYLVTIAHADGRGETIEVAMPAVTLPVPGAAAQIMVRQIGTHGASRPMILPFLPEIP
ncbi:hypothetical protein ASG37_07600 [Sphingomonas sp. Leaf407]|uniref:GTA baseplate fiber-binding domain-containing protein n=1 Tax=unclassified Sphingomonas TaxID=196159 RepID=UPI0006F7C674|nr:MULTISPECIES: phage tail protein [unclassified Sphingomonas]KQN39425.1 hypothetical protein ASE97_04890 [Sphingomonas sp. Leaf42]KQT28701.1 hypothetical protein ASG37_07600 [Sphingomonas sp. Leaf407]